jgi:hypothetical protein
VKQEGESPLMTELLCQSTVNKLLKASINYKEYKRLAEYLKSQTETPIWDIALVWTPEIRAKFWRAMGELQKEFVPQHIDINSLYNKLWVLLREVALNKSIYQDSKKLKSKVSDFANEVKKPLAVFDVICEIRNFDVGSKHFELGNVQIFKLTKDYLQSLDLIQSDIFSNWEGRFVTKVEVSASYTGGANVLGKAEVNNALNVLRLAVRKEFISRSSDSLFLWELGNSIVIPKVKPREGVLFSMFNNREVYPFKTDLGNTVGKLLEDGSIWRLILDAKLPEDIKRRVIRATEWISHAITSDSLDYKLVNLCTALEILLLPNHKEGQKGALLALRQVLIGRGTSYTPESILYLYNKRSVIIHSGLFDVTSHSDYWNLLVCSLQVLESIVRLSQKYPHIQELENLLAIVESKETLEDFIKHCEQGMFKGQKIGDVKKAAEKRLEAIGVGL